MVGNDARPPEIGPEEFAFSLELLKVADPRYLFSSDGVVILTAAGVETLGPRSDMRAGCYRVVRFEDLGLEPAGPGRVAVCRFEGER